MQLVSKVFYERVIPYCIQMTTLFTNVQAFLTRCEEKHWYRTKKGRLIIALPYYATISDSNQSDKVPSEPGQDVLGIYFSVTKLGAHVDLLSKGQSLIFYRRHGNLSRLYQIRITPFNHPIVSNLLYLPWPTTKNKLIEEFLHRSDAYSNHV